VAVVQRAIEAGVRQSRSASQSPEAKFTTISANLASLHFAQWRGAAQGREIADRSSYMGFS